MNHFSNIPRRGLIQAIVLFMVILSILFLIFQNMIFVAAGGGTGGYCSSHCRQWCYLFCGGFSSAIAH